MLTGRELVVGYLLDCVVICLLLVEPPVFRDGLLRTIVGPVDRRGVVEPLEILVDVRGGEIVVRLGVLTLGRELMTERLLELRLDTLGLELRLDGIELERLGEALRVEILGALLRLDVLGALGRLTLLVVDLRG